MLPECLVIDTIFCRINHGESPDYIIVTVDGHVNFQSIFLWANEGIFKANFGILQNCMG